MQKIFLLLPTIICLAGCGKLQLNQELLNEIAPELSVTKHQAYLKAPNVDPGDYFGRSVAASQDTVLIGAINESSNQTTITNGPTGSADNSASGAGAAYVFVGVDGDWSMEAYLKAPNADAGDNFGLSVALDGDTALVGAPGEDSNETTITNGPTASADNSAPWAGAVYVFVRQNSAWSSQAYLKAPNALPGTTFGSAVALDGDTAIVTSYLEFSGQTTITNGSTASADTSQPNAGAVYVFKRTGGNWAQEAYLKSPNAIAGQQFGRSVSLDGDTLVVGAPNEHSAQTTITNGSAVPTDQDSVSSGAAYVFRRTGGTWAFEAYLKAPNNGSLDRFASSVSVSGDRVAVGALNESSSQTFISASPASDDDSYLSGAVYTFVRSGSLWSFEAYLKAFNATPYDRFGASVSLDGSHLLVGAIGEHSGTVTNPFDQSAPSAGAAYLFMVENGEWKQKGYLKAPNLSASDQFGYSLSLSEHVAIIGAFHEDSDANTIINGPSVPSHSTTYETGSAYVFRVAY